MQELIALLEVDGFTYDDYSGHSKAFKLVRYFNFLLKINFLKRETLLSLWQILLEMIEKTDEEVLNYYKTILLILKR